MCVLFCLLPLISVYHFSFLALLALEGTELISGLRHRYSYWNYTYTYLHTLITTKDDNLDHRYFLQSSLYSPYIGFSRIQYNTTVLSPDFTTSCLVFLAFRILPAYIILGLVRSV